MRTVVHVGLHKAASRFLNHEVFAPLRQDPGVAFNPRAIADALRPAQLRRDAKHARRVIRVEHERLRAAGCTLLLLSRVGLSGDMYEHQSGHREALEFLRDAFPDAHVLIVVRYPPDWLLSAYRQSLVKGAAGPIERFLNFYEGEFQPRRARRVRDMRTLEPLRLEFEDIVVRCDRLFGADRVWVVRQEDLRSDRERVMAVLQACLDHPLPRGGNGGSSRNRGFSALAIQLFCGGRHRVRPDDVHDDQPRPRWYGRWVLRPLRRLRMIFIRHVFDRIVYRDWDLLARNAMRERLDARYTDEYARLTRRARALLDRGSPVIADGQLLCISDSAE